MANIEFNNDNNDMSVVIRKTGSGNAYRFELHGNHLEVEKWAEPGQWQSSPGLDWYRDLTEQERLNVFRSVLSEYRERSLGEGNFKLAALGVTESGDIYVSENTEQLSDDIHRQCAEQNMVTISAQRDVYNQIKSNGRAANFKPQYPRYRDVYLMGGQLPEIPIACPCGNCTDLLAKVMDKDANIWMMPVDVPGEEKSDLIINEHAYAADELNKGEAWKTTIGHLNKDRVIKLSDEAADKQREAYEWLFDGLDEFLTIRPSRSIESPITDEQLADEMYIRVGATFANHLDELARMAGHEGGVRYMDRDELMALAEKHIHWVRCAAVQRTDGEWAIETLGKSPAAKALPSPETVTMGALGDRLASHGIRRMEVMECSPWHVREGSMRTSPKAAIERGVKNRPKNGEELTLRFHALSGKFEPELNFDFTPREIFPSYFTGKKPLKLEQGEKAAPATHPQTPDNRVNGGAKKEGVATELSAGVRRAT